MKEYVVGADNAALGLKEVVLEFLRHKGLVFQDVGVLDAEDDTPYPIVAKKVVEAIQESKYQRNGILLCGTGIGMAITANKFPGIYAATCHDTYSAERARLSNDTNVISMGARVIGPELAKRILEEWTRLEFVPGSSSSKLDLIRAYEKHNFKS